MKIGLLTSHRAQKQYEKEYWNLIGHLEKKGHEVIHSMDTTLESLLSLDYIERERAFYAYFHKLEACDLIIGECSIQSTHLGFGLSYLRDKGKPIVIVSQKGAFGDHSPKGEVYSEYENMMVAEYETYTMLSVIDDAIAFMQEKIDKRFTMIFPAHLMAELEALSQKKRLPKAVYIRQLLEASLKNESESQEK